MPTTKDTKTSKSKNTDNNLTSEMKQSPLHKFFLDGLKDMLYAEKALIGALDKMYDAATTDELKDAFEEHKFQTSTHYSRLEKVFKLLGEEPEEKTCAAMEGLIKEATEIINSTPEESMTRDAALIIAAQKVEHYEIASYGGLTQLAITMNHTKVANILEKILQEEEDTDLLLTDIAETSINMEADEETKDSINSDSTDSDDNDKN
jgi:ferritin-like metal-binding protein YciE